MLHTIKQIGKITTLQDSLANLINSKITEGNNNYYLNFDNKEELKGFFNMEYFGFTNKDSSDKLSYQTYEYLCKFLWLIFNKNIYEDYIKYDSEVLKSNEKIINLNYEFNKYKEENKTNYILDENKFKTKGIKNYPLVTSYKNIENFLENILYISDVYVYLDDLGPGLWRGDPTTIKVPIKIPKPENDDNISIHNIFLKPQFTQRDHRLKYNESLQPLIFKKISHIFYNIESHFNESKKENNMVNYNYLDENKSKFFIKPTNEEGRYIKEYFEFLQDNFNENKKYKDIPESRLDRVIPKYNTDEGIKEIIKEYGKYVLDNKYYENSNIDNIYSRLKSDNKTLSFIITYYNIFKILQTFYLPYGCILKTKIFKENLTNEIKKTSKEVYIKVKSIKCIKLNEELINYIFNNKIIEPIYEIEFEEISTFSNIEFYINLIDRFNPTNHFKNAIENIEICRERFNIKNDKIHELDFMAILKDNKDICESNKEYKKSIIDINNEIEIYKKYNNNIFSKNKNINLSKIFIDNELNIYKLINNFNIIKNNYSIFKKYDVKTIKDILMIDEIYNELKNINELNNNTTSIQKIIKKYYIEKFLFEINSHLFIDDKYAKIKRVEIRLLNKMTKEELKNNKLNNSDDEIEFKEINSKDIRLAIDKIDTTYQFYLDVHIILKDSPKDIISLKDEINYANNCIKRATILDDLLYNALGINYPKKYLENKLQKKDNLLNSTKKNSIIKSIPSNIKSEKQINSEKSQKGGNNKFTRKIINKEKKQILTNLMYYYYN